MRKILFIINRKAGTDREKRLEDTIRRHLPAPGFSVQITHLAYLGHGTHLAQEAVANGVDTVVAVGGDGSINEIAQGLTGSNTALAIIPLGSGNGLARALKIPLNVEKALQLIAQNKRGAIDAGYANGHLFLSNAGVGFDALIAERFRNMQKRGLQGYAKLVIKSFREYKDNVYTINIDGNKTLQKPAFLLSMANGNQLGYEFKLSPQADLFDGLLDVVVVPPVSFLGLLPLCIHSLLGTVHKTKYMQRYTGRNITVSSPKLAYLQVDGDAVPLGNNAQVEFKVVKAALQVIVNN
ncbi:diacylglycerol kinase family lipid kinase [Chitinophaga agrisoli]|uniref:Diacylglycerol kinase family lipid kinase n=1 Tax=Chitinophaga agrisoli TaxID=2607653 RepID=A0A5B2W1Z1_9BACT|nr:diacylglycerol kinase family protein [Chitinophaga agrisoli]KAA2244692.1 diacylglycerol kinase family lipid kinase [Chitinophaga agrisoli]